MIIQGAKLRSMKRILQISLLSLSAIYLAACSTAHQPYAYDDVYYDPATDPIKQVEKDPSAELNKTDNIQYDNSYPNRYNNDEYSSSSQGMYQNRYTEAEHSANNTPYNSGNNQTVIINNNSSDGDVEYYDPEYAETVRNLNTPVQSFNSYDPYLSARVAYTNDPFFYGPNMYANYNFYDPFVPSAGLTLGWNSWSGWNVGIGIGFGYAAWGYSNPYYNPWRPMYGYNPWNPWAPSYGYGWGYGWGCDPYWAGYNHGYYHGYNDGYYHGGGDYGSNGRRYINTPRGSNGSRAFTEPRERTRPSATTPNNNYRLQGTENQNARVASPASTNPNESLRQSTRSRTPSRYSTNKTPETYSRPSSTTSGRTPSSRTPSAVTPNATLQPSGTSRSSASPSRQPSQSTPMNTPRTTQSRPYSNDSYNSRRPINTQSQPNYQSRPSYSTPPSNNLNRSRPSYNSTPSYSPSRSMGGGSPSRSSSPSRSRTSTRSRR